MGKYLRGNCDEVLSLGTLAGSTALEGAFGQTVNERTLVSSIVATYTLSGMTPAGSVGPITVGVCHGDYTSAEIEAWIENTGSWNETDLPAQEIAGRKIREIGVFDVPADALSAAVLNDGKPIKTKLNWILTQGQTLNLWAYNSGSLPLATTVPVVRAQGHVNLFPK